MGTPDTDALADLAPTPEWAAAFRETPRHLFVPDVAWTTRDKLIDREADPDAWWAAVHHNDAIITQIDDGNTDLTDENVARNPHRLSSSCTAPSLVLHFLQILDPYPGDQVLEIGTGTGWTAGLLSARLGAENVTSMEVDEQIAKQAAINLERAGHAPNLVVGDGTEGWPGPAPYDRIHVTCGVRDIPHTWVEQTRPGGVIVVPWSPSDEAVNYRTRLTVTGSDAIGRFYGECGFMKLRSQRRPIVPIEGEVRDSASTVDPRRVDVAGSGLWVALAGLMPGVSVGTGGVNPVDGTFRMVAHDLASGSHAIAIQPPEGGATEVRQRGPRSLWQELEAAYLRWVGWGEPGMERFGLTVTSGGQQVWLGSPNNWIADMED